MIFILSGNLVESEKWMVLKKLERGRSAIHLFRPEQLIGYNIGIHFVRVGTWYKYVDLPKFKRIEEMLVEREAVEINSDTLEIEE